MSPKRRQQGFTLIELVAVVATLVILAGLVLPKLDLFQLKANKGVAASNMHGISRFIQQYRIQHNLYPDNWDSLVTETGSALWAPGDTTPGLDPQLTGGPPTGSPTKLATTTLTEDATTHQVRSLTRMGITTVLDVAGDGSTYDSAPGNAFTVSRALADGATVATINAADEDGQAIIAHLYPATGVVPADKTLVVFGLGPLNQAIGSVLNETPTYSNTDPTHYYNRHLAIFEVDNGGGRAQLVAIVGGDADRMDEEIGEYYE